MSRRLLVLVLACLMPYSLLAQGTRLLRQPTVSEKAIVFVYAGDLWTVDRTGGEARRLTSSQGIEADPQFSPDGKTIAFTGNYAGNNEVYLIDAVGGEPRRLTWHPEVDAALGWTPDGKRVLMASNRASAPINYLQLWTVSTEGGLPDRVPVRSAARASYSASGKLLAYEDQRWQSEWKWYRGGQAKPIRVVSFPKLTQVDVPGPVSVNTNPSFLGEQLYFLSDRDGTFNVFAYNPESRAIRQLTHYVDKDIKSLSAGGGILVFEVGGAIHTLNPATDEDRGLTITVHGDFPQAMTQWKDVKNSVSSASLSPNGARALFEARGDVFTVPAEKGDVRNLTHSSGSAEHSPAWSPDGQRIAWFSDQSGEYKLIVADQNGLLPARQITIDHPTYFFDLAWSPDSKNVAFTNAARELLIVNVEKETVRRVDTDIMAHPERSMIPVWAPDSRWIAYAKQLPNKFRAVIVYSLGEGKSYQITDGLSDAVAPAWDLGGKYLYFLASTDAALNTGWLDLSSLERPRRDGVYFAVLAKDTPSPLLPESDDEKAQKKDKEEPKKKGPDSNDVKIDFDGIVHRILSLPLPLRNYVGLERGPAGVLFVAEAGLPFYPEQPGGPALTMHRWDMSKRKEITFLSNVKSFSASYNGTKVLYSQGDDWFIAGSESEPKPGDGKLKVELRMLLDPIAEWQQIYREAWRLQRDFFYVPNYHGTDWNKVYTKYAEFLPFIRHRADLNYVLDMMGGELAVGHHFVNGGDMGDQKTTPIGLLGADMTVENGKYRFKRILTGENWNPDLRAPLAAPGVDVHEGDYLIAVNGVDLVPPTTPEALLEGLAGKQVVLSVNSRASSEGAHNITVVPLDRENALRSRAWVEDNRRYVDNLSGGKLAYVWLPNTSTQGYTYFNRY